MLNMMKNAIFPLALIFVLLISACAPDLQFNGAITSDENAVEKAQQALANDKTIMHDNLFEAVRGIEVGNIAPDFSVTTTDGEAVRLSDYRDNKPVLVYFMATWCPYCRQDFTALSPVYADYKDDIEFIVMSLDLSETGEILAQYKTNYPLLSDIKFAPGGSNILANYKVLHTTAKYAVKRDGTLLYKGSGAFSGEQWTALLEALKNA